MYFITEWTKRIDFDLMRSERVKRATKIVNEFGLEGVLCFRVENIRYLTGLRPGQFFYYQIRNAALFRPGKDPICFVDEGDWEHRRKTMYWMQEKNIRPLPNLDEALGRGKGIPLLTQAMNELDLTKGRIGIDMFPMLVLNDLRKAMPKVEFVDGDECIKEARKIKNSEEIKTMRVSSLCADLGMNAVVKGTRPGRRECELLGEAARVYYGLGMEIAQCQSIMASGENTVPLARFAPDKIVRGGEIVFADIGGCFNGIYAELTRSYICGEPNAQQKKIYQTVYKAQMAVIESMKPGVMSDQIYEAQLNAYRKEGMEEYAHLTALGHGIGTGGIEPPYFGDPRLVTKPFELKANMVFSIEPTLIIPGVKGGGGIRIEDEILITENGNERLTRFPYDEKLLS